MPKKSIEERFWSKVHIDGPDDCWEWQAAKHGFGHGLFGFRRKVDRAHRVAWVLTFGEIPEGLCVLHKCDNPPCCNPDHLFPGTRKDNNMDMAKKERHGLAKLTRQQADEIREKSRTMPKKQLASDYRISLSNVYHICNGEQWVW